MPQEMLWGDEDGQLFGIVLDYALAAQPGVDAWVYGPVDEVFLLVGNLRQRAFSLLHVHVARAAAAYATAVVLQLNTVVERHVQHRFTLGRYVGLGRLSVLKLKNDIDDFHGELLS